MILIATHSRNKESPASACLKNSNKRHRVYIKSFDSLCNTCTPHSSTRSIDVIKHSYRHLLQPQIRTRAHLRTVSLPIGWSKQRFNPALTASVSERGQSTASRSCNITHFNHENPRGSPLAQRSILREVTLFPPPHSLFFLGIPGKSGIGYLTHTAGFL